MNDYCSFSQVNTMVNCEFFSCSLIISFMGLGFSSLVAGPSFLDLKSIF